NLCPAAEATLYAYRNPGEDMNQAVSITGQSYSSMPNAFRYRNEFVPSCSCKAAGQTSSDALNPRACTQKPELGQLDDVRLLSEADTPAILPSIRHRLLARLRPCRPSR